MSTEIETLNKTIQEVDENLSIFVKQLDRKEFIYEYNISQKLISASIIKVPIMLAILEEVKSNNITLDDKILVSKDEILNDTEVFENGEGYYSIKELITWMIIKSDNTATNVLIKQFTISKINEYIRNVLNLKSTILERYMLDENAIKNGFNNYTSQEDMYSVFEKLFNKEILTDSLCDIAIEILYNQRCQNQVLRYIYNPIKYAHKTGHLYYLNHDIGVMNINEKLFYVGISITNSKYKDGNKKLIGNLGKIIYEYLMKN